MMAVSVHWAVFVCLHRSRKMWGACRTANQKFWKNSDKREVCRGLIIYLRGCPPDIGHKLINVSSIGCKRFHMWMEQEERLKTTFDIAVGTVRLAASQWALGPSIWSDLLWCWKRYHACHTVGRKRERMVPFKGKVRSKVSAMRPPPQKIKEGGQFGTRS